MSSRAFRRSSGALLAVGAAALLAGCGGGGDPSATTATTAASEPALLTAPRAAGEVVLRGEASPAEHGPVALRGRYRVRFVQYAPEDPRLDFGGQTAFLASLRPAARGPRARATPLFRAAARSGERTITLDGRYRVEVSFGDFPYGIRFTPLPR